jgi:thioredoxin-like negative regulator of GroEL
MRTKAFLILAGLAACGGGGARSATPSAAPVAAAPAAPAGISWIEDDLPRALAEARRTNRPLLVDMWATWCHTCLSMKSYVFPDPGLAPLHDRFVWASIDTEKEGNAAAIERYPVEAYPTFYVIDPADGGVASRWLGSMSVKGVRAFLEEGERTVQLAHAGQIPPGDPLALLLQADRAAIAGRDAEAADLYRRARAAAPLDWPRRAEALLGEIRARSSAGDASACADLALAELDATGSSPHAGDFGHYALECAGDLPSGDPRARGLRQAAHDRMLALARDRAAPLAADDRGDILRGVWAAREALGDPEGAREIARERLALLDAAAAAAPDAEAASTFDGARLDTLLFLGRGADAVRVLSESERRLPRDYNPPHRLARAYLALGRLDEALAAIDRALAKAYGPRKMGVYTVKADILEKQGRRDAARAVVLEQLAFHDALPPAQQRPAQAEAARKRLASLR